MNEEKINFDDLTSLGEKELLDKSYELYNSLRKGVFKRVERKNVINDYRKITHHLTKQTATHSDPITNLEKIGIDKIYNGSGTSSDKILKTLNNLKNLNIVTKPDKIDLLNFLTYQKAENKQFNRSLNYTPPKLKEKYGSEKTTESRFDYLVKTLQKDIKLDEGPSSTIKKVMRISHDYNRNQGGLQSHLQELNKGLSDKKDIDLYQVLPITRNEFNRLIKEKKIIGKNGEYLDTVSSAKIKPIFISQDDDERMARLNKSEIEKEYLTQFKKLFEEINPDVVHVHNGYYKPHNKAAKFAKSKGKKVIHTWHGGKIEPNKKDVKERLQNVFDDTARYVDSNYAISNIGKEAFSNTKNVKVAYGVNLKEFSPESVSEQEKQELRTKLGINKKDHVYLFPGRYHGQKNQDKLIRAFGEVAKKHNNAKLILAGQKFDDEQGQEYISKLNKLISEYNLSDKVLMLDKLEKQDLVKHYSIANTVVYPSKNEGRGRSLIEAMAMGKTVLASGDAGLKDSIETSEGRVGILFSPSSYASITKAMNYAIENPQRASDLAHKAKQHAEKNLSIDTYVNEYYQAYKSAA